MPRAASYAGAALSLAHLCELEVAPATLVEHAARAGFASVGFRTFRAAAGGVEYPLSTAAEQSVVRAQVGAHGAAVLYIELISLSESTRAEDYRPMLATGAAIGASRVAVAGDSPDLKLVGAKMAAICDLAGEFGIAVDLEFMPFRAVRNLAHAVEIVNHADRANAHILVDALHVFRSGSSLEALAKLDRRLIGTVQLCDAPLTLPAGLDLVTEARSRRLLPGAGELPLWTLLDALPADVPLGVEVPLAGLFAELPPAERLARLAAATRSFLEGAAQ